MASRGRSTVASSSSGAASSASGPNMTRRPTIEETNRDSRTSTSSPGAADTPAGQTETTISGAGGSATEQQMRSSSTVFNQEVQEPSSSIRATRRSTRSIRFIEDPVRDEIADQDKKAFYDVEKMIMNDVHLHNDKEHYIVPPVRCFEPQVTRVKVLFPLDLGADELTTQQDIQRTGLVVDNQHPRGKKQVKICWDTDNKDEFEEIAEELDESYAQHVMEDQFDLGEKSKRRKKLLPAKADSWEKVENLQIIPRVSYRAHHYEGRFDVDANVKDMKAKFYDKAHGQKVSAHADAIQLVPERVSQFDQHEVAQDGFYRYYDKNGQFRDDALFASSTFGQAGKSAEGPGGPLSLDGGLTDWLQGPTLIKNTVFQDPYSTHSRYYGATYVGKQKRFKKSVTGTADALRQSKSELAAAGRGVVDNSDEETSDLPQQPIDYEDDPPVLPKSHPFHPKTVEKFNKKFFKDVPLPGPITAELEAIPDRDPKRKTKSVMESAGGALGSVGGDLQVEDYVSSEEEREKERRKQLLQGKNRSKTRTTGTTTPGAAMPPTVDDLINPGPLLERKSEKFQREEQEKRTSSSSQQQLHETLSDVPTDEFEEALYRGAPKTVDVLDPRDWLRSDQDKTKVEMRGNPVVSYVEEHFEMPDGKLMNSLLPDVPDGSERSPEEGAKLAWKLREQAIKGAYMEKKLPTEKHEYVLVYGTAAGGTEDSEVVDGYKWGKEFYAPWVPYPDEVVASDSDEERLGTAGAAGASTSAAQSRTSKKKLKKKTLPHFSPEELIEMQACQEIYGVNYDPSKVPEVLLSDKARTSDPAKDVQQERRSRGEDEQANNATAVSNAQVEPPQDQESMQDLSSSTPEQGDPRKTQTETTTETVTIATRTEEVGSSTRSGTTSATSQQKGKARGGHKTKNQPDYADFVDGQMHYSRYAYEDMLKKLEEDGFTVLNKATPVMELPVRSNLFEDYHAFELKKKRATVVENANKKSVAVRFSGAEQQQEQTGEMNSTRASKQESSLEHQGANGGSFDMATTALAEKARAETENVKDPKSFLKRETDHQATEEFRRSLTDEHSYEAFMHVGHKLTGFFDAEGDYHAQQSNLHDIRVARVKRCAPYKGYSETKLDGSSPWLPPAHRWEVSVLGNRVWRHEPVVDNRPMVGVNARLEKGEKEFTSSYDPVAEGYDPYSAAKNSYGKKKHFPPNDILKRYYANTNPKMNIYAYIGNGHVVDAKDLRDEFHHVSDIYQSEDHIVDYPGLFTSKEQQIKHLYKQKYDEKHPIKDTAASSAHRDPMFWFYEVAQEKNPEDEKAQDGRGTTLKKGTSYLRRVYRDLDFPPAKEAEDKKHPVYDLLHFLLNGGETAEEKEKREHKKQHEKEQLQQFAKKIDYTREAGIGGTAAPTLARQHETPIEKNAEHMERFFEKNAKYKYGELNYGDLEKERKRRIADRVNNDAALYHVNRANFSEMLEMKASVVKSRVDQRESAIAEAERQLGVAGLENNKVPVIPLLEIPLPDYEKTLKPHFDDRIPLPEQIKAKEQYKNVYHAKRRHPANPEHFENEVVVLEKHGYNPEYALQPLLPPVSKEELDAACIRAGGRLQDGDRIRDLELLKQEEDIKKLLASLGEEEVDYGFKNKNEKIHWNIVDPRVELQPHEYPIKVFGPGLDPFLGEVVSHLPKRKSDGQGPPSMWDRIHDMIGLGS
ncbi:unnamed protein product [Amoebophrya sp. A120]|nr:unnamed protein product [Amoebophrya sp. A120]|eukprot:GSA120T00016539001.1